MPLPVLDMLVPFQHHQSSAGISPSNHYDTGTNETEMKLQQCQGTSAKLQKIVKTKFVTFRGQLVSISLRKLWIFPAGINFKDWVCDPSPPHPQ